MWLISAKGCSLTIVNKGRIGTIKNNTLKDQRVS